MSDAKVGLLRIVVQHLDGARKGEIDTFCQSAFTVGRAEDCDLAFPNEKSTSTHHAVIRQRQGKVEVSDTQSTNGTFVNEVRVDRAALVDGDLVRFGVLGPVVKISLPSEGAAPTVRVLPNLPELGTAHPSTDATPAVATLAPVSVTRDFRFVRNAAVIYLGGAVGALGVWNTVIERYKLDTSWFSAFLLVLAGGLVSTLTEAWYRSAPGVQPIKSWELALHAIVVLICTLGCWLLLA
jgi:FHA domain